MEKPQFLRVRCMLSLKNYIIFIFGIFVVAPIVLNAQEVPYEPCNPTSSMPTVCLTEYHTCSSYDNEFPCSTGYCFSGQIPPDAGIPISGVVSGQIIEIDGAYQITQNVVFSNCDFKMRGGASIAVVPVSTGTVSVTFENCNFFGCKQMWYGIAVDASAAAGLEFTFTNCNVEDAHQGLLLDEGAQNRYFISGNEFLNNTIGITNRRQNNTQLNAVILLNKFYATDNLAAIPPNMPVSFPYHPLAYVGIDLIRTIASIGRFDNRNEFSCLLFGIRNNNGAVGSSSNDFHNINESGNAIWAYNGTFSAIGCTFNNAGIIALQTNATNLLAATNHFSGRSQSGIQSDGNLNSEIVNIWRANIFDISEDSWRNGVKLGRSNAVGAGYHNRIAYNRFNVYGNAKSIYPIFISDLVTATDELHILGNNISVNQSAGTVYGMWLNVGKSNGIKVENNRITFDNSNVYGSFGIYLQASGNTSIAHALRNNTITGQTLDAMQCNAACIR